MAAHKILNEDEIGKSLKELPDWSYKAPNITAKYTFHTFRDAIAFIVQVAIEAEVINHHPEFFNSYNVIEFAFCTHDVGHKVTDTDIKFASKISQIAARFLKMQ